MPEDSVNLVKDTKNKKMFAAQIENAVYPLRIHLLQWKSRWERLGHGNTVEARALSKFLRSNFSSVYHSN